LSSFDTRLYLDVNRFAERTAWAHEVMRLWDAWLGVVLLAFVLLAVLWRARGGLYGGGEPDRVADVLWAAVAGGLAVLVAQPIAHVVGRARPYAALHQPVEVLVGRAAGFGMPSGRAALAGAVVVGVLLAGDWILAAAAAVVGLLLAASEVYVGAAYPGDALAGLLLGIVLVLVLRPPALGLLRTFTDWCGGVTGLRFLTGTSRPVPAVTPPALVRPGGAGAGEAGFGNSVGLGGALVRSAAVRILEAGAKPVPHVAEDEERLVARAAAPARPHVNPSRPGTAAPAAAPAAREAGESGRRGAAGSAGDL
jgi:undecaprenyl-diphosphatase